MQDGRGRAQIRGGGILLRARGESFSAEGKVLGRPSSPDEQLLKSRRLRERQRLRIRPSPV